MNFFDSLSAGIVLSIAQAQKHFDVDYPILRDSGDIKGEQARVFRDSLRLILLEYNDHASCSWRFLVLATVKDEKSIDSKKVGMDCDADADDEDRITIDYKFLNDSTFVVYERTLHGTADTVGPVTNQTKLKIENRGFVKIKNNNGHL